VNFTINPTVHSYDYIFILFSNRCLTRFTPIRQNNNFLPHDKCETNKRKIGNIYATLSSIFFSCSCFWSHFRVRLKKVNISIRKILFVPVFWTFFYLLWTGFNFLYWHRNYFKYKCRIYCLVNVFKYVFLV